MKKALFVASLVTLLAGLFVLAVRADDSGILVKFKGGIGLHPVSNVSGTQNTNGSFPDVTPNVVRGINPAGQLWVIERLEANVKTDGEIDGKGEGLILAGGNNAGRATGQKVFATLICEDSGFIERNTNTAGITLSAGGDFEINDVLAPWPSSDCPSPMLLIRNASGQTWFAVGIRDFD